MLKEKSLSILMIGVRNKKELECPNCGAKLKEEDIDESGERGKCPYCSTILDFQRLKVFVHTEHNTYYGKPIKLRKKYQ